MTKKAAKDDRCMTGGVETETVFSGGFPRETDSPVSLVLYHEDGARLISLSRAEPVVIGRSPTANISVADRSLTRKHARVTWIGEDVWLEDLGSTNGTRVNGRKITKSTRISVGDEVRLGSVGLLLHQPHASSWKLRGVESYDVFAASLLEEVARAKIVDGKVAVLLIRQPRGHKVARPSQWCPWVQQSLDPPNRIGMYGRNGVLVSMPETGVTQAMAVAERLVAGEEGAQKCPVICGVAVFPDHAASADELLEAVRDAARGASPRDPIHVANTTAKALAAPVVASQALREVYELSDRVVNSTVPVLILGETGTGKNILAQEIHRAGSRRSAPLRCINCAAIPQTLLESTLFGHERGAFTGADRQKKGLFEEADGGTVVLDECGELSAEGQAALLRALETQRVMRVGSAKEISIDTRVLATTNRDLRSMAESGAFRWDLFYRLNMFTIVVPPLRDRQEEIIPLATHFLKQAARTNRCPARKLSPLAQELLEQYPWPGNVRELRNVIERAVLITESTEIAPDDLSEPVRRGAVIWSQDAEGAAESLPTIQGDLKNEVDKFEARLIVRALTQNQGNQTKAAKVLGLPLRTLIYKMKKHNISSGRKSARRKGKS